MKKLHYSQFRFLKAIAVLILILTVANGILNACTVPVFRYALERWSADAYQVDIVHRGDLSSDEKAAAKMLEVCAKDVEKPTNFKISYVDAVNEPNLPDQTRLTVYYPFDKDRQIAIWKAPLTKDTVEKLIDSPVRKEISNRLLGGDCAVWILLESGDNKKDEAARKLLAEQLKIQQKTVQLPEAALSSESEGDIEVVFSIVRLSRDDRTEDFLVSSLLEIESDLRDFNEPMAWPVFGRGRALLPFVGKGITKENIAYGCQFLCSPCACTIKFDSPGFDLLIGANWQTVQQMYDEQEYVAELTGVVVEPQAETEQEVNELIGVNLVSDESDNSINFTLKVFVVLIGIGAVIIAGSFLIIKRGKQNH